MSAPTEPRPRARLLGGWLPHALAALAALAALGIARTRHIDSATAWDIARDASQPTRARIGAIQRLACRATEREARLGDTLTRELLSGTDPLLAELALTALLCRHHQGDPFREPTLQPAYLAQKAVPGTSHYVLAVLHYLRKVGGPPVGAFGRLDWREVAWFLNALQGRPAPSAAEFAAHLESKADEGEEVQRRRRPNTPR